MRPVLATAAMLCLLGCSSASSPRSLSASTAPAATVSSSSSPVPTGSGSTSAVSSPAIAGLSSAHPTSIELARRHAPLYRFNAWVAGSTSPANVSEDYFPMSVRNYFDQSATGQMRLVVHEAKGASPGSNEVQSFTPPVVGPLVIGGAPGAISGDLPGTAPVYFHCYEDVKARTRNPDGSGTDLFYIEYWLFYGKDRSRESILGITPVLDLGGHKGDWEMVSVAATVVRGPGGVFLTSNVARAFFTGHDHKTAVELADLELVDDLGVLGPHGTHPVVYVSVGKHASFPRPGYWIDILNLLPLFVHDEFFLGNGFAWSTWQTGLLDLEGPSSVEFSPPGFLALLSPLVKATNLTDWRHYDGRFGDSLPFKIPFIGYPLPLGDSPRAPRHHGFYGSGAKHARKWADVVSRAHGLVIQPMPPVVPAPLPTRK